MVGPTRRGGQQVSRGTARAVGALGFAAAMALPLVLFHRAIASVASDFRLEADYLVTGWSAYGLIAAGLLFLLPVVISSGRGPRSRLHPRRRNAYVAWGT